MSGTQDNLGNTQTAGAPSPGTQVPAAGEGQVASPTPASSPDPFDDMSDDEAITELLRFDPFKQTKEPTGDATPPAGAPAAQAPQGGNEAAPVVSQPAAGQAPNDMQQAAQALREAANAMRAQPAQAPGQVKPDEPNFNFSIPQPIFEALNSQDPQLRLHGTQALVSGTVRAAHQLVMKELEKVVSAVPQYVERMLSQRNTVENIRSDFYQAHKPLANPHFAPVVGSVMQEVFTERQKAGLPVSWSPELRDAIAERVYAIIPGLKAAVQQRTPVQPTSPASPIFTNGSRPAAPKAQDVSQDVINTFFTGRG